MFRISATILNGDYLVENTRTGRNSGHAALAECPEDSGMDFPAGMSFFTLRAPVSVKRSMACLDGTSCQCETGPLDVLHSRRVALIPIPISAWLPHAGYPCRHSA